MKTKRELVLPTAKWECSYLVGIDDAGQFHVFAWDTWREEYEDQVFFTTYSCTGKLKKLTVRKGSELAKELGIEPVWHKTDWPGLQKRTGLFPVQGRLYFESKPPTLPYCQEKWYSSLPYGEYYVDDEVLFALHPRDQSMLPALKLEDHLIPLTEQECEQVLIQLHEQERRRDEQEKEAWEYYDRSDYHRPREPEHYGRVLGVVVQNVQGGAWLETDLALMLRHRDVLLELVDGTKKIATAPAADLVEVMADASLRTITLPGKDCLWATEAHGLVRTRDGLFARSSGLSEEYWWLTLTELEYDEKAVRAMVARRGETKQGK